VSRRGSEERAFVNLARSCAEEVEDTVTRPRTCCGLDRLVALLGPEGVAVELTHHGYPEDDEPGAALGSDH